MSVAQILDAKGRDVVTIEGGRTLAEAVALLNRNRIGAVVVVDAAGSVQGILSERDVVRALGDGGPDAFADTVSARMTRKVVTCRSSASLPDLMGLMTDGKFRHIPVVDDGRLGGMISIGDLVKQRLGELESEHQAMRDYIATG